MKKIYNNPTMNISLFEKEDIVTESTVTTEAEVKAIEALNTAGVTSTVKVIF